MVGPKASCTPGNSRITARAMMWRRSAASRPAPRGPCRSASRIGIGDASIASVSGRAASTIVPSTSAAMVALASRSPMERATSRAEAGFGVVFDGAVGQLNAGHVQEDARSRREVREIAGQRVIPGRGRRYEGRRQRSRKTVAFLADGTGPGEVLSPPMESFGNQSHPLTPADGAPIVSHCRPG